MYLNVGCIPLEYDGSFGVAVMGRGLTCDGQDVNIGFQTNENEQKGRGRFQLCKFIGSKTSDDIPDVVPEIGYLDDAIVAKWVIESISKDLPKVSLA